MRRNNTQIAAHNSNLYIGNQIIEQQVSALIRAIIMCYHLKTPWDKILLYVQTLCRE